MSKLPDLVAIELLVCRLCLNGRGGECHVPGCAFWMADAPTGDLLDMLNHVHEEARP